MTDRTAAAGLRVTRAPDADLDALGSDVRRFAAATVPAVRPAGSDATARLRDAGLAYPAELIGPLERILASVTGSPGELAGGARHWAAIAARLRRIGPTPEQAVRAADWHGPASAAADSKLAGFRRAALEVAGQADDVADVLRLSGTLLGAAEAIVTDLLDDYADYAIAVCATAAAAAGATGGASVAAARATLAARAARDCGLGADAATHAGVLLARVLDLLDRQTARFHEAAAGLERATVPAGAAAGGD